jgi:hypothetical protein
MKIDTDMGAIDKAIADALICGTGVMKFSFTDGMVLCDHVPIKDFREFGEELKWRSQNTIYEEKNA